MPGTRPSYVFISACHIPVCSSHPQCDLGDVARSRFLRILAQHWQRFVRDGRSALYQCTVKRRVSMASITRLGNRLLQHVVTHLWLTRTRFLSNLSVAHSFVVATHSPKFLTRSPLKLVLLMLHGFLLYASEERAVDAPATKTRRHGKATEVQVIGPDFIEYAAHEGVLNHGYYGISIGQSRGDFLGGLIMRG